MSMSARRLHITGIVQGVGFRPFIYNLANTWRLTGWVLNSSDGVHIHAQGDADDIDGFIAAIRPQAPRMARIDTVDVSEIPPSDFDGFTIAPSFETEGALTLVSPDIATCPACVAELFNPADRRYRYPFINCTQCGPRFTIIRELPYDRPRTSMEPFTMCADCAREYDDPADRRFHAQPDACFSCGPELFWYEDGTIERACDRTSSDALIARAVRYLEEGRILAVKGLGGYHLVCDATNSSAVVRLRDGKRRPTRPFAGMFSDLASVETLCQVDADERALLLGTARPIVLLRRRAGAGTGTGPTIAPEVAGGLRELGVMLPYTPVQHLLLSSINRPLVMTSGNLSEEPILATDDEAFELLSPLTDAILGNNRDILSRYDDSVMRIIDGSVYPVRRARGYAPMPLAIPPSLRSEKRVLACGPEQKNTFCLTTGGLAFVSQHLGDLDDALALRVWTETIDLYQRLFQTTPDTLACDLHPEYLSTKWAKQRARDTGLPLHAIQHHHAHIAAVCAQHDECGRVIGVALDGTGYGTDHTIWGGEILLGDLCEFERVSHLRTFALPGGSAAINNPCRMALSVLKSCGLIDHPGTQTLKHLIDDEEQTLVEQMIDAGLNSPLTSSAGRLFDAMSALLGICPHPSYEGEPAIMLEAAIDQTDEDPDASRRYTFESEDGLIDPSRAIRAALDDMVDGCSPEKISRRFHDAFANAIVDTCIQVANSSGCGTAALGGGVFMNRYLLKKMKDDLEMGGLRVLIGHELPANDGCIAYGQAMITLARMQSDRKE